MEKQPNQEVLKSFDVEFESIIDKLDKKQKEGLRLNTGTSQYYEAKDQFDLSNQINLLREIFSKIKNRKDQLSDLGFTIVINQNINWDKLPTPDDIKPIIEEADSLSVRKTEFKGFDIAPTPIGTISFCLLKGGDFIEIIKQEIILMGANRDIPNTEVTKKIVEDVENKLSRIILESSETDLQNSQN